MFIDQVLERVRRQVRSCYFIVDQSSFFSDLVISELRKTFLKKETPDDFSVFYPDDLDVEKMLEELNTLSMFSPKRLMVVKESDSLIEAQILRLAQFVEKMDKHQETQDCCLVFTATQKPKHRLFQYCQKREDLLEFKKPYESQMPQWVEWFVKRQNKIIDPKAVFLLIDKVGTDMLQLRMEVEKISLYIGERKKIEEEDIQILLYSTRAHSIFELTSALGCQKPFVSLKILERMVEEGESEIFIFSMILKHLRNLWLAVEWKSSKADVEVQKEMGIHPFFWNEFRKQRDFFVNAPFEDYWKKAWETDRALKTSNIKKQNILFNFVRALN